MSFSAQVKTELSHVPLTRPCCIRAELYGVLLYATVFTHREIRFATENEAIARRIRTMLFRAFSVDTQPQRIGRKFQFCLTEEAALRRIFDRLGYDYKSHVTYHLNRNVLENDCCAVAFLRGVFLPAGTVAGPDKKSHLEIKTAHQSLSGEVMSLMLDLQLSPKLTVRQNSHVLYFKDSTRVEDFLTLIGAPRAALELMEAKVEKNIRNTINRQVNCETANLVKATDASARQIAAIQAALARRGDTFFPDKLRETVQLRLAYPTDSLAELAARFDPPISKPGLSHRLRKITELAQKEAQ
ncbi:DNA-binding protein WhiA [Butyricicoccus sp. Marseille-Q5471]|uniref:DNA-binding protein WhiA n=1 Tax=Butyricicoccus sp. Marseille-Q5471 TaxID=3039493 RepID=UPI0024BCD6CA|nr:DNA-binding protein WhiA [Butyricicoccus sp. Marseille-Q5471]